MKKTLCIIGLGLSMVSFTACATKPKGLSKMPVVVQGKTSTIALDKRITLVPAGTSIPVNVTVGGDVFKAEVKKTIPIILKADTYFYSAVKDVNDAKRYERFLVSYDKKRWFTLDKFFKVESGMEVSITPKNSAISMHFNADKKVQK